MIKMQKIKLIREKTNADYLEAKSILNDCNENVFLAIKTIKEKRKHLTRDEELFVINHVKKLMPNSCKEKDIKKDHKYIGYHNTKEVCSATHWNKKTAQFSCEDILQLYFHKNTIGQTKYSLDHYIGWEIVYVGYKEIKGTIKHSLTKKEENFIVNNEAKRRGVQ